MTEEERGAVRYPSYEAYIAGNRHADCLFTEQSWIKLKFKQAAAKPVGGRCVKEGSTTDSHPMSGISAEMDYYREKVDPPLQRQVDGNHYKNMVIQPIEYNQKNKLPYCEAAVVKYVSRHRFKGGKNDILKAIHCLEMLLELEYNDRV